MTQTDLTTYLVENYPIQCTQFECVECLQEFAKRENIKINNNVDLTKVLLNLWKV
jgi:hypothetical protein